MEIPHLLRGSKRSSQRPRPPDDIAYAHVVHGRFSRAIGVLGLAARSMGEGLRGRCDLGSFKQDCLQEVIDALASDAYRAFLEREFEVRFRLDLGGALMLYASKDEDLPKLEGELVRRYDRRTMEHAYSLEIGELREAINKYERRMEPTMAHHSSHGHIRRIMADFACREDIQRRSGIKIGFETPNRVTLHRSRVLVPPNLVEQLAFEKRISGTD